MVKLSTFCISITFVNLIRFSPAQLVALPPQRKRESFHSGCHNTVSQHEQSVYALLFPPFLAVCSVAFLRKQLRTDRGESERGEKRSFETLPKFLPICHTDVPPEGRRTNIVNPPCNTILSTQRQSPRSRAAAIKTASKFAPPNTAMGRRGFLYWLVEMLFKNYAPSGPVFPLSSGSLAKKVFCKLKHPAESLPGKGGKRGKGILPNHHPIGRPIVIVFLCLCV